MKSSQLMAIDLVEDLMERPRVMGDEHGAYSEVKLSMTCLSTGSSAS